MEAVLSSRDPQGPQKQVRLEPVGDQQVSPHILQTTCFPGIAAGAAILATGNADSDAGGPGLLDFDEAISEGDELGVGQTVLSHDPLDSQTLREVGVFPQYALDAHMVLVSGEKTG